MYASLLAEHFITSSQDLLGNSQYANLILMYARLAVYLRGLPEYL
jgi:hypothetical protein